MARTTLREHGIMLRSRRTRRRPRRSLGGRKAPIIGMISIDERPEEATDRRVAGHWEGDLIIGAHGRSAAITLAGRTTRFVTILALPKGKDSAGVCDALIDHVNGLPDLMKGTLTWDQGSEMHRPRRPVPGPPTCRSTSPIPTAHGNEAATRTQAD